MTIVIMAIDTETKKVLYYAGYGEKLTGKGLGSGALTGTNRVPKFTDDIFKRKKIETFIDAKRIMGEIIDAIRYKDIEGIDLVTIQFIGGNVNEN